MSQSSLERFVGLSRGARIAALADAFPDSLRHDSVAAVEAIATHGGRAAAVARLSAIDPEAYARTRNHVAGAVTGLSPWLRHGVLSLCEVRDAALGRVDDPAHAEKLISELGWRDYWRQVHAAIGGRIRSSIEPPAARSRQRAIDHMPADVLAADTGMACIDAFVRTLHDTGWLHNHERMWLASWLVHTRGVRWQAGADWFLSHLLDADPASNHLSWQWVAGTFSAKPYLFNRENLERFTDGIHCRACPVAGHCDVEGSYELLADRVFTDAATPPQREPLRIPPADPWQLAEAPSGKPLVWLTLDSLSAATPAAAAAPEAPRLFVLDPGWLTAERPALKRLAFIFECLADIPGLHVVMGDPAAVVPAVARQHACHHVAVTDTPCPRVRAAATAIAAEMPVHVVAEPPFCDRRRVRDLGRFSRYWSQVSRAAMAPTPTR